jgi:DNA-binding protein Fis
MPVPSPVFTLLLLTTDSDVQAQFEQIFRDAAMTVVRDAAALHRATSKQPFDAVIVESPAGGELALSLRDHVHPSRTLLITGSRSVLRKTAKMMQWMSSSGPQPVDHKMPDTSLEGYLEMKMGDFVKGMRNGSARNLHPILISAVERPLITSALRETQGNQIQAAELLGLNRNTLRKKITDLHIPLKRTRAKINRTV